MPAHQPPGAIGNVCKSTGSAITAMDWRANHLVDGLAKLAAAKGASTQQEAQLLESAEHLVKHCVGQLAAVTHAANNHRELYVDDSGRQRSRGKRDSQDFPKVARKAFKPLKALEPAALKPTSPVPVQSSSASGEDLGPSVRARKRATRAQARRSAAARSKTAFEAVVLARRRNHREAALDLHRRKQLAVGLAETVAPPADSFWGSFLNLPTQAAEAVAQAVPPESASPTAPLAAQTQSSVAASSYQVSNVEPPTRSRPIKGSSKITAADSRAALDSLLGNATKTKEKTKAFGNTTKARG